MKPSGLTLLVALGLARGAFAADRDAPPAPGDIERARALFVEGAAHAAQMRWSDALARFEASARLHAHAATTYNIAICQRSLGHYALARSTLAKALTADRGSGESELPSTTRANIDALLEETARVLGTLVVRIEPAGATLAVDGRPLEKSADVEDLPTMIAGTRPPGPGEPPPAGRFRLIVDPGAHVFVLSRKGYTDAVVRRSVRPGETGEIALVLEKLPGALHVTSAEKQAAVAVDGVDVGLVPVAIERPPGRYHVLVRKEGFESYELDVTVRPGERIDLTAPLQPDEPGLHERWWFWVAIAGAIGTAATITYFATRPEPERPPLDGGGLGWTIRVP